MSNTIPKVKPMVEYLYEAFVKDMEKENTEDPDNAQEIPDFERFKVEYANADADENLTILYNNYVMMHIKAALATARELAVALGLDPEKADKLLHAYTENDLK